MNPLTNMKNVIKLSERDLQRGGNSSWHDMYRDSAWIFVGGMPFSLTEGDIIAVFSQYGEIVNINLIRDKITGKSKGFCFICYEDQRSTVLAVDNLNGIKILTRTLRVDHVSDYKPPKEHDKTDEETRRLYMEGCAPKPQIAEENIKRESDQIQKNSISLSSIKCESKIKIKKEKKKKSKKEKKEKKSKKDKKLKKKRKKQADTSESSSEESTSAEDESSSSESEPEKERKKNRQRSRSPSKKYENRPDDRSRDERKRNRQRSRSRSRDCSNYQRRRSRSR